MTTASKDTQQLVQKLFATGAHYGYSKARRHPSSQKYLFGAKSSTDVFDLEQTVEKLAETEQFVQKLAASGRQLLFVGGKLEARALVRKAAESVGQPFVAGRWVGGTLSNFTLIRKRVEKMLKLMEDRDSGQLNKYTKRERLLIDRDIKRLDETFGGLATMKALPGALFLIDPRHEKIAVKEAATLGIPVIALANSDCNMEEIAHVLPANDANVASIAFFVEQIANAYREGAKNAPAKPAAPERPRVSEERAERRPSTRSPRPSRA